MNFLLLPSVGRVLTLAAGRPVFQAGSPTAAPGAALTPGTGLTPGAATPTEVLGAAGSPTAVVPGAVSSPTALPTPANVETPAISPEQIPQGQVANPLSLEYLGQAAQPGLGLFSGLFALLSLALLGGGIYLYFFRKNQWRRSNPLNYRLANFWGVVGMSLGGLGVLFSLFRIAGVEGLNARFWLYLLLLVMLGFAGYAIWYFRVRYPADLAKNPPRRVRPPTPSRSQIQGQRQSTGAAPPPARPGGTAGNPRGTSTRGQRRREKKR